MGQIQDFESELLRRSAKKFAQWHAIDLHNHTPASPDYLAQGTDAAGQTAEQIRRKGLSVVMFSDHEQLPTDSFVDKVGKGTSALLLKGVELNVFVDAWDKPESQVGKNLFFHLLIGFDPNSTHSADYWLSDIYRHCNTETRASGSRQIKGIRDFDRLFKVLSDSNALIIPAHLHSNHDAFRSRSCDDIFVDPEFLSYAKEFTALEVTQESTAAFFDGQHDETNRLHKTCIRSSDSHEPGMVGSRPCWLQMENVTFNELKAGLEMPFRVSLHKTTEPRAHVVGLNIQGQFFQDLWLSLSPNCNVFIGVKGSGKTSVLECLRFVLGAEVPQSRQADVESHLQAILGPAGSVRVLLKREDGGRVLVTRSITNRNFQTTFEDGSQKTFQHPGALQFPASILGWHEIEQAATDAKIRRVYLDTIAGREKMRQLEEQTKSIAQQIHYSHDQASSRFRTYRDHQEQVKRLRERREGLQKLTDAKLIKLKEDYETALHHREQLKVLIQRLEQAKIQLPNASTTLLPSIDGGFFAGASPIDSAINTCRQALQQLLKSRAELQTTFGTSIEQCLSSQRSQSAQVDQQFGTFAAQYHKQIASLSPEDQQLLESHRRVMEETKALPNLEAQSSLFRTETEQFLNTLIQLCEQAAAAVEERSGIRRERVAEFSNQVVPFGVHLSLAAYTSSSELAELGKRYPEGLQALNQLLPEAPEEVLFYRRLKRSYEKLLKNLANDDPLFFRSAQFSYFLDTFEDDDLQIKFQVNPTTAARPIDQLSAGQRCTAIFPVLLKLREGPLVVDQPEDNLDNRHIAKTVAPAMLLDKNDRQIVLTSHNANLVVLSDAEHIVAFEGEGEKGVVSERGFLASPTSDITLHVLDILDGGAYALELRIKKYGVVLEAHHSENNPAS